MPSVCLPVAVLAIAASLAPASAAAPLAAGDILIVDPVLNGGTVIRVDPVSGSQSIFASGPFKNPIDIVTSPIGDIYLAAGEGATEGVQRLDPATGAASIVSAADGYQPVRLALGPTGTIYTIDNLSQTVIAVDPITGGRTTVGAGGIFDVASSVQALAVSDSGILFVRVANPDEIWSINPATGSQSFFAPLPGPPNFLGSVEDLEFDSSGNLLVLSRGLNPNVVSLDPAGFQTVVSSMGLLDEPEFMDLDGDGSIIVSDFAAGAVFSIDPVTGVQTSVSSGGVFDTIAGVAVFTVPEPAPVVFALLLVLVLEPPRARAPTPDTQLGVRTRGDLSQRGPTGA